MQDHAHSQTQENIVDKKDLAALWAVGILVALLLALAGFAWTPAHYEAIPSKSVDPMEARIENSQNKMVSDALNEGKIEYHDSMQKLVKLRPFYQLFFVDLSKVLLFPTLPILIIGLLIRKTGRQSKEPRSS